MTGAACRHRASHGTFLRAWAGNRAALSSSAETTLPAWMSQHREVSSLSVLRWIGACENPLGPEEEADSAGKAFCQGCCEQKAAVPRGGGALVLHGTLPASPRLLPAENRTQQSLARQAASAGSTHCCCMLLPLSSSAHQRPAVSSKDVLQGPQNHRMLGVAEGLQRSLGPTPCPARSPRAGHTTQGRYFGLLKDYLVLMELSKAQKRPSL